MRAIIQCVLIPIVLLAVVVDEKPLYSRIQLVRARARGHRSRCRLAELSASSSLPLHISIYVTCLCDSRPSRRYRTGPSQSRSMYRLRDLSGATPVTLATNKSRVGVLG